MSLVYDAALGLSGQAEGKKEVSRMNARKRESAMGPSVARLPHREKAARPL